MAGRIVEVTVEEEAEIRFLEEEKISVMVIVIGGICEDSNEFSLADSHAAPKITRPGCDPRPPRRNLRMVGDIERDHLPRNE